MQGPLRVLEGFKRLISASNVHMFCALWMLLLVFGFHIRNSFREMERWARGEMDPLQRLDIGFAVKSSNKGHAIHKEKHAKCNNTQGAELGLGKLC